MWEYPHEVTFQALVEVDDGGGGKIKDWVDLFTTEAHVQPINSNLQVQAQQLQAPIDHKIFYPYQEGVKKEMRAKWGEQYLQLRSSPLDQGGLGEILMVKAELNG